METIDPRLQRLASIQEWSDAVILHFLASCEMLGITGENILAIRRTAVFLASHPGVQGRLGFLSSSGFDEKGFCNPSRTM
ncbi:hypothetical protein [Ralstonia sp. ASV6]|uniref:hypothetical protein n=1 Tax=Ralstonia sp. ASV6 TaxID=2795124 RepID=UPI0018EDA504|nr:hypothetical protein [Ralstonia sp. ASV6]